MNTTSIGWIGLGKMGIPMSSQLIKAGYPLTVYNRSKEKEAGLRAMGASIAPDPSTLIQQCQVVILMVTDDNAIREIFSGSNGLLSANVTGRLVINMSTISPAISREFAGKLQEQENDYLDAPVSGSVKQAQDAQLVIMAGGDEKVFLQAKPVLDTMGKLSMLVGGTGAGNAAKLAINSLLSFHALGLAEAITFAQKNGIQAEQLTTLINSGALANPFMKIKGDAILQQNFTPAFALKHLVKDLGLARAEGLDTPLGNAAYETFRAASEKFGEEDLIAVIKQLEANRKNGRR